MTIGTDEWKTFAATSDNVKTSMSVTSDTFTGTISDNQLTAGVTFTKQ
jgi:hypothetical protein